MEYIVNVNETKEQYRVEARDADEAQRIVTLRKGIAVNKTRAFIPGFIGEFKTDKTVHYFIKEVDAETACGESYYPALIPLDAEAILY